MTDDPQPPQFQSEWRGGWRDFGAHHDDQITSTRSNRVVLISTPYPHVSLCKESGASTSDTKHRYRVCL